MVFIKGNKIRNTGRTRFKKGQTSPNKGRNFWEGKKHPRGMKGKENKWGNHQLITRKKISSTMQGIDLEEWNGFVRIQKYSIEFYRLRDYIKKRDNYECKICKISNRRLDVHHIDYNKQNNFSDNLITLCISCHSKTNKDRAKWTKYFNNQKMKGGQSDKIKK